MALGEMGDQLREANQNLTEVPVQDMCTDFDSLRIGQPGPEPFAAQLEQLEQILAALGGYCINRYLALNRATLNARSALEMTKSGNPHAISAKEATGQLLNGLEGHEDAMSTMDTKARELVDTLRYAGELVRDYNAAHADAWTHLVDAGAQRDVIVDETQAFMNEIGA